MVSNPEFLREGAAIDDFKQPDRVVIGVEDEAARLVMREIYRPLERNGSPIVCTTPAHPELIKYAANVYLAMKVTFINEIADLCEKVGGDVLDVAHGIGLDKRIGRKLPQSRPRLRRLVLSQGHAGADQTRRRRALADAAGGDAGRRQRKAQGRDGGQDHARLRRLGRTARRIAVLGLTYKPNTDDMRDAPSLVIVPMLQAAGRADRRLRSRKAPKSAEALLPGVEFASGPYACLEGADALVVITEWDAFRALDLARVKAALRDAGGRRPAQHLFHGDDESARLPL